jgi:hypothetical protein
VRGQLGIAVDVADQCVHPDWQFMRIREKRHALREAMGHNDHDMLLSWLPHHTSIRKESIENPTLGNHVLVWWKPASLRSLVSIPLRTARWQHAARVALEAARHRLRSLFGWQRPSFEGEIVTLNRFDDRTDALWHEAKHQFDFAVERTQDYLNWRYADHRSDRFVVRVAVDGDRVLG